MWPGRFRVVLVAGSSGSNSERWGRGSVGVGRAVGSNTPRDVASLPQLFQVALRDSCLGLLSRCSMSRFGLLPQELLGQEGQVPGLPGQGLGLGPGSEQVVDAKKWRAHLRTKAARDALAKKRRIAVDHQRSSEVHSAQGPRGRRPLKPAIKALGRLGPVTW